MTTVGSLLLGWAATGLHGAGLTTPLSLLMGYARREPAFPILSYHRINDDDDPFFPSLPTEVFEQQMAFVARAYVVLPLEELVERMHRRAVPRNALAISFDDGYRDNLTHAAPILVRYGLPASVFVVSGAIGAHEPLWFDRLAHAFKRTRVGSWNAPWGETFPLGSTGSRLVALARALEESKRLTDSDRRRSIDDVLSALGSSDQESGKNAMLSWDDVHALIGLGMSIGAHTVSHPILSRISLQEAEREIERSRATIANVCGRRPRSFAYPNGRADDYTEAIAKLVQKAGFTCAVTTRFGINTRRTSPFELYRGGPWERDVATFALKLAAYRLTQA